MSTTPSLQTSETAIESNCYCSTCEAYHDASAKHLTKAARIAQERDMATRALLEALKPGDRVRTILRHVSRSGMQREISLVIVDRRDGEMWDITYLVGKVLGYKHGKTGGLIVGGCGMDMGFHLVYNLGSRLWPNGTSAPHGRRNGEPDSTGGYALKHDWL